jgi:hypothetical protein
MADKREKPSLIRAHMSDGTRKAVRTDEITTGPLLHKTLAPDLEARISILFARVGKYINNNLAEWREDFLRDQVPESEVVVWEHIADVVDRLWIEQPKVLSKLNRQSLLRVVIAISISAVDIPSQIPGVTDEMVASVRDAFERVD